MVIDYRLLNRSRVSSANDLKREVTHDKRQKQQRGGMQYERKGKLPDGAATRPNRNVTKEFGADQREVNGIRCEDGG